MFNYVQFFLHFVTKELCISAAGAIYVKEGSFIQSGGNLTITDASAKSDGGVVRIRRNPVILAVLQRRRVSGETVGKCLQP